MDTVLLQLQSFDISRDLLILGGLLIAVSMSVFILGYLAVGMKSDINRRVGELSSLDKSPQSSKFKDTLESLSPLYVPGDEKERESIRHQLMHAGYHNKSAVANFYTLKLLSFALGLIVAGVLYLTLTGYSQLHTLMLASAFVGLFLPNFILRKMVKTRQSRIRGGVPDALDLLVVCTESGLGFMAALKRVASETYISHPELADELETICIKVKAGVELPQAFSEMVVRTGLEELNGLVSMLSHASRIGGSLAATLRDYNEDYRDKRNQAAEEIAAKIPTKMMFPMILFIWPCFFIVALGPAILTIMKAFE